MHITHESFGSGYTAITEYNGKHSDMLMDFGILKLSLGEEYVCKKDMERSFLLLRGTASLRWGNEQVLVTRSSVFNEAASVLHVPAGLAVRITAEEHCELALNAVPNGKEFSPVFYKPGDYRSQQFGKGTMQETSTRTVRTVFDGASAEYSQMVLGEVLNYPGKWSSYPPHTHPQPEIYHFRFQPEHGFGFSAQGEQVYRVENGDTVTIVPGVEHPQVAAPGYCMYYLWAIPHLPNERFGPDSRNFVPEHAWLLDENASIWEPRE